MFYVSHRILSSQNVVHKLRLCQLGCVLTVPAHATDAQRQATKSAAELAGFNVLRQDETKSKQDQTCPNSLKCTVPERYIISQ